MLLEFLFSALLGIVLGIITGLIPGIHTNLIASLIIVLQNKLSNFPSILILLCLTTMLIVSIFLNFLPSLILGIPDPEKTNIIRPLHRAILKGKAYLIIKQVSITLFLTSIFAVLLFLILRRIILLTNYLTFLIPFLLILIILSNLIKEKRKMLALGIILLAGTLGLTILSNEEIKEPLLPLLSGLFGLSSLITNLNEKQKLKKQFFTSYTKVPNKEIKKIPFYLAVCALVSFIPAVSSSQLVSIIKKDTKTYLLTTTIFTISTALMSFLTIYTLEKARNGVVIAMNSFLKNLNEINVLILIFTILIASSIGTILLIKTSKIILINLEKINIKLISEIVIMIIIIATILLSGFYGLIILVLATSLGIITNKLELNRNYLMSSLIIPTIFYFI